MRKLLYILFLLFPPLVYAQEKTDLDSLHEQGVERLTAITDSLQILQAADSLQQLSSVVDSQRIQHKLDSLRKLSSSLDTLKLNQSLDSIQNVSLPTEAFQTKADSIQELLDVSAKANQKIEELNRELDKVIQKGQHKVDKLVKPEGVNQQVVGDLRKQTGIDISTELPKVEGISMEGVNEVGVPDIDIPAGELSFANLPKLAAPNTELPEAEGLGQLQEAVGKAGDIAGKTEKYTEDISSLAEGKLDEVKNADKLAEEQLMKKGQMSLFKQQEEEAMKGVGALKQFGDKDVVKQTASQEVTKVAINHFAGQKDKLQAARTKLMKYKGRYSEIKSVRELPKNPLKRNPLKGKPWQERIIIGSILQFSKGESFRFDIAPFVAYRVYDKLEIGAAYQKRVTFDKKAPLFLTFQYPLSGYSLFADYKFKRGFFVRGTFARLHTRPKNYLPKEGNPNMLWMNSYELGLGKSFTFYKALKGYTLIQYSFSSGLFKPYASSLQSKIAFYINGKHLKRSKEKK